MKINALGQAVGGRTTPHIAGTPVRAFVGRVAGSPQGCWWGDRVLCQTELPTPDGPKWRLVSARQHDATFEEVAGHGQHRLFANDRIWVCLTDDGYRDSLGGHSTLIAPVGLDDASDLVAVRVIDTNDLAVVDARTGVITPAIEPGGPDRWDDPDIDYRGGVLVYRKGGILKAWSSHGAIPTFAHIPAAGVRRAGGYLLEYQEGRGVTVRHESSTSGIVVMGPNVLAFGADMRVQDSGTLLVVSSSGSLELPHEFRYHVINPQTWTVNGHRAEVIDLSRLPADVPPPVVIPDPPPVTEPDPMPPDHRHVVNAIHAQFPHLLGTNTYATCREFVWRAAAALASVDPKWGFLTKNPPENHVVIKGQAVAVDAVTYRDWDGAVDIINSSTSGQPTTPSWGEEGKRPSNVWMQAFPFDEGVPEPTPQPEPTPTPTPTPSPCQVTPELINRLEASQAAILEALQRVASAVERLEAQPPPVPVVEHPPYRVRVLGQTVTAYPVPPQ